MALHDDLLDQAKHLARREPRRPKQASLRRAVSAAYYSLFHLLVTDGARTLAPAQPATVRLQVRRAFVHSNMKAVCKQFSEGTVAALPDGTRQLVTPPIDRHLIEVAKAFVELQEARHQADYDVALPLDRIDALGMISMAERASASWAAVRGTPNATAFLAALLLQRFWKG